MYIPERLKREFRAYTQRKIHMFNDRVYECIKETGQTDKLNDYYCEIESDGLYMGCVYTPMKCG